MNKTPESTYKIRFSDCDLFGHLNNARYLDYFLHAREEHLEHHYGLRLHSYYVKGISWVVGGHQIAYLKPVKYAENVVIQTRLLKSSDNELLVEMLMMDESMQQLKSLLWTSFIPVDPNTGRRRAHDDEFMGFAKSIECPMEIPAGFNARVAQILSPTVKP